MNPLDPVGPWLTVILAAVVDRLDHYGAPVCRAFIHPGATAPWDVCERAGGRDGQAWVAAQRVYPANPFPTEDLTPQRCAPVEYGLDLVAGVVRCTATVDDRGDPPPAAAVTGDALRAARDAAIVREALLCVLPHDDDPGVFRLGAWTPLGPLGGCAGGQWAATLAIPACPCPEED